MLKKLTVTFIINLLTFPLLSFAQSDTIYWKSNYKLTWDDFEERPDTSLMQAALTHCNISYKSYEQGDKLAFKVTCFFNKSKSWSKHKDNMELLNHEQGHFNIAELFARKLRKELLQYNYNEATVLKDVPAIFKKILADKKAYNALYDNETELSKNKDKQDYWDKKIMKELEELKEFVE